MEVILLEKIRNLGDIGDKVKVKAGYGRNHLVPQGKALPATAENVAELEKRRAELEKTAKELLQAAEKRQGELAKLGPIKIAAEVSEEGKLYGSIGVKEIADAISAAGTPVEKSEIDLPTGSLKEVGEYQINIILHSEVTATVTVVVGE